MEEVAPCKSTQEYLKSHQTFPPQPPVPHPSQREGKEAPHVFHKHTPRPTTPYSRNTPLWKTEKEWESAGNKIRSQIKLFADSPCHSRASAGQKTFFHSHSHSQQQRPSPSPLLPPPPPALSSYAPHPTSAPRQIHSHHYHSDHPRGS